MEYGAAGFGQTMRATHFCQRSQSVTIEAFLLWLSSSLMTFRCRASSEGFSALVQHLTNICEQFFHPERLGYKSLCAHLNGFFH
jgi:hypothetical protein